MAVEAYSKQPLCALGPCRDISTTFHYITIYQDGIPNIISPHRALLVPCSMQLQNYIVGDELETPSWNTLNRNLTYINDKPWQGTDDGRPSREETINHFMNHSAMALGEVHRTRLRMQATRQNDKTTKTHTTAVCDRPQEKIQKGEEMMYKASRGIRK